MDSVMDKKYLDDAKLRDLIERSERDFLTGVYNRETFYSKVYEAIHGELEDTYVVCTLDIDKFKLVNDLFGAAQGDRLLKHIGASLLGHFGAKLVSGRLSADNFAVLLRQSTVHGYEQEITDQIQDMVKDYPLNIQIIIRCGFYYIHDSDVEPGLMCDRANLAMQEIKGSYSRRFAIYDEKMRSRMLKEQEILNEMGRALTEEQFSVFYQPKYNMEKLKIIGSEALVRWIHPEKGMISPGEFIPIFEKNGFIATLDYYVWEHVCMDIAEWIRKGYALCPVSVNVSRAELYNVHLVEQLVSLVEKYDVPISMLQLEITESAYTENPEQLIETINRLREKGFVILMDDFGSGYSSLNTLKDVPVDVLKIDLKFLYNMDKNYKADYILKSVVQMAKRLDLVVIAEGVETNQQAEFLKSIGCVRAQGYLFAKPMDESSFRIYLNNPAMIAQKDDDEIEGLINIDDIMSRIHREDEIEWYRAAVIQMKGIMAQYEVNSDIFSVFDMRVNEGSKELVKVEIPNFLRVVREGKYIYPDDVPICSVIVENHVCGPFQLRARNMNHVRGYRWYELEGRFLTDVRGEGELFSCVVRDITDIKANEAVMGVLTAFESNERTKEAIAEIFPLIGDIYIFDRITMLFQAEDKRVHQTGCSWSRGRGMSEVWEDSGARDDIMNVLFDDIMEDGIVIYQEEQKDTYHGAVADYLFPGDVKTVSVASIHVGGGYRGMILYENCDEAKDYTVQDKGFLVELTKCIASNLQRIFEQMHKREVQSLYRYAFEKSGFSMWEWNIRTKTLYRSKAVRDKQGFGEYVENIPDAFVESGVIAGDYAEDYRNMYRRLCEGHDAACTFKSRHLDGTYKWMRIAYSVISDESGSPVKAVGFGEDVNAFCDRKVRICRDLQQKHLDKGEILYAFAGDVTARDIPDEYRELFERSFDYDDIIRRFLRGDRYLYMVYQVENESGEFQWVEASTYLEANPKNNHVIFRTFFRDMREVQAWSGCEDFEGENDKFRVFSGSNFEKMVKNRLREKSTGESAALLVIKLKEYQILKDIYGYRYWEDVMFSLAAVIKASKPLHSALGRISESDFCIYIDAFEKKSRIYYLVERMTRALQTSFTADRKHYSLGPDIGMAFTDECSYEYEELLLEADRFLEGVGV